MPKLEIALFLNRQFTKAQIAQITNRPNYKCPNYKLPKLQMPNNKIAQITNCQISKGPRIEARSELPKLQMLNF